jgi:hypothetical protein
VKLFAKGKGQAAAQPQAPAFSPIDRIGLLGLLDQVVNGGQSGVLELREPRGNWVYGFQAGALTHASGGRVRGARHAFDLLWEFQNGEFMFTPGVNPSLAGNLYIDKGRLTDLLRRSQAALQGPSAPYIPPDQQRPIAPVPGPYQQAWQPGPGQFAPQSGQYAPQPAPGAAPPWPPAGQPGMPSGQPGMPPAPSWGAGGYPQQPGYPAAPYPAAPYQGPPPQGQPYPPQQYPQPRGPMPPPAGSPQPGYPNYPQPPMAQPAMPPQGMPQPAPPAPPARPVTPPSFSVPPMAIPRKREAAPTYQPPVTGPAPAAPSPPEPAKPAPPKDDLAALRASLVAQAPPARPAPSAPGWGVRTSDGAVAAPQPAAGAKAKGKGKGRGDAKIKKDSRLMAGIKVQLIKFLLWACERKYSPDDHWTLKDAFEVSTMELRDQFIGAFSESFKASKKREAEEFDDVDNMAAGRMRGRGRKH